MCVFSYCVGSVYLSFHSVCFFCLPSLFAVWRPGLSWWAGCVFVVFFGGEGGLCVSSYFLSFCLFILSVSSACLVCLQCGVLGCLGRLVVCVCVCVFIIIVCLPSLLAVWRPGLSWRAGKMWWVCVCLFMVSVLVVWLCGCLGGLGVGCLCVCLFMVSV